MIRLSMGMFVWSDILRFFVRVELIQVKYCIGIGLFRWYFWCRYFSICGLCFFFVMVRIGLLGRSFCRVKISSDMMISVGMVMSICCLMQCSISLRNLYQSRGCVFSFEVGYVVFKLLRCEFDVFQVDYVVWIGFEVLNFFCVNEGLGLIVGVDDWQILFQDFLSLIVKLFVFGFVVDDVSFVQKFVDLFVVVFVIVQSIFVVDEGMDVVIWIDVV